MKVSHRIHKKYEYLAKKYAGQVYLYDELGLEFEDLVQEFSMKIYTSILAYGRRWAKYRRGEASRPIPIRYYLECACGNKKRDFMKYISRENHKLRIDDINYDFGIEDDYEVNPKENKFIVRGIDLLEGLTGKEKLVFSLYLRGYNTNKLSKVYFSTKQEKQNKKEVIENGDEPFGPSDIIEMQINYLLKKYGSELRESRRVYTSYQIED